MKKILLVVCLFTLLTGCEIDKMKMKTCSYNNASTQSHVDITAFYTNDNVPKIVVEMKQRFEESIASKMSGEKIEGMVRNSMLSTIGDEVQMEMEYDDKKKEVYVKVTLFTKDMEEEELKIFIVFVKK